VSLEYKPGDAPKELYIGSVGVSDDSYKRLIVDWRSPVAEVYYNQDEGQTSYVANGRKIDVNLLLRRQFDIETDKLKAYFDTNVAIEDTLLLESLSRARTSKMKAITATIQKEQNVVIRHEDVPALLVEGVAGSGKTSVLLQRIAYLFYQKRETLKPHEVVLVTPNPVFKHYIENVLPELGETNPRTTTYLELTRGLMPKGRNTGNMNVDMTLFDKVDCAISRIQLSKNDFNAVEHAGKRFVGQGQIAQLMQKYARIEMGPRRIALVREELLSRVSNKINQMTKDDATLYEISALTIEQQLNILHETFDPQDEKEAYRLAKVYLNHVYAPVFDFVENDKWIKIDRIGMRILDVKSLDAPLWLYFKIKLCGTSDPSAKYVMVDEIQDYTQAQLRVLTAYFRRAHFMLLGDRNQAILPGCATFDEIEHVFQTQRGAVSKCMLGCSYRSTTEITRLFAKLAEQSTPFDIQSVQPQGEIPEILECSNDEDYALHLKGALERAHDAGGLCALVVSGKQESKRVAQLLGEGAPRFIQDKDKLPHTGVIMLTLKLAKGLEFDHVILANASAKMFDDGNISRHRLYTAISRATKTVSVLSLGQISTHLRNL
jgi:DNA helicase-2/ATP-dependent DNA helicase PcrA